MKSFVCASLWAAAALACGTADPTGLGEPIVVRGGTFEEGGVPGSDPPAEGQDPVGPHVTIVESANNVLRPGQVGKRLSGRATDDAVAIAVALDGEGTGYWVIPTAAPDPAAPGELTWGMAVDVGYDVSPGLHTLLIAAVDAEGRAGSQFAQPVCVRSEVPDGLHACDPSSAPPAGVLSLGWDTNVDLDLLVFTPQGKWVDPKHPSTAIATDDGIEPGPGDGEIDHDGLAHCEAVGPRRENLVFEEKPAPGTYYVLVNLFDACGLTGTRFEVTLLLREGEPGEQVEALRVPGQVLAAQANGGAGLGLYVTSFTIQ